jgi:hypothetical protein
MNLARSLKACTERDFAAASRSQRVFALISCRCRRASAKLEFLRQKKALDEQRAAEAKAKQDASDHRAALIAVFSGVKSMNEIIDKVHDDGWSYRQIANLIDVCFMLQFVADSAKASGKLIGNAGAVSNLLTCGRILSVAAADVKAWDRQGPRRRLMM